MHEGGCHCGAVRYRVTGEPIFAAICHCNDCRLSAGAIMVGWICFPATSLTANGGPLSEYVSPVGVRRQFCGTCGTGLFYYNDAAMPGLVDIQLATLDDAAEMTPKMQVQVADELPWVRAIDTLPRFDRYPEAFARFHEH